ncbi:hypothetical protein C8J57DRAFT_1520156 [Mycena rebaudengoi]|nr:hypothetical protein C8J57DRAFT_1520156 [Mycena rebaudengoi]
METVGALDCSEPLVYHFCECSTSSSAGVSLGVPSTGYDSTIMPHCASWQSSQAEQRTSASVIRDFVALRRTSDAPFLSFCLTIILGISVILRGPKPAQMWEDTSSDFTEAPSTGYACAIDDPNGFQFSHFDPPSLVKHLDGPIDVFAGDFVFENYPLDPIPPDSSSHSDPPTCKFK